MTTEQLSKAVYDKMHAEQQAFRRELLKMKPEEILDQAYVYAVREDILCAMENTELSMRQAYALLVVDTPLAYVYKTYVGKETDYMENINDSLEKVLQFCTSFRGVYDFSIFCTVYSIYLMQV